LIDLTRQLFDRLAGEGRSATALVSRKGEEDPLRFSGAPVRAYDATIDLRLTGKNSSDEIVRVVAGLGKWIEKSVHVDLSAALIGEDHVFVAGEPAPIRYQYLMRRRADFTHAAYLKRYAEVHSQLGMKTRGIRSYVQFHVDPELSRKAAASAGVGIWAIDSVSELHLESMDEFLAAVASSTIAEESAADEELFVDRPNSVMFTSDELIRFGDRDHSHQGG
jgi:hypothetical protein